MSEGPDGLESAPDFRVLDAPALAELTERAAADPDVVPTPWENVNKLCGDQGAKRGLAKGWHNLLVGLTGVGKSIGGLQVTGHAMANGVNCVYVSNEMSREQLTTRLLAQQTQTDIRKLEPGDWFDLEARKAADEQLAELPGFVTVNDNPVRTVSDLEEVVRFYATEEWFDCDLFVLDYLQLFDSEPGDSVAERIRKVSHAARRLARRYEVVTVGLSQFSRKQSPDEPPSIFNLKGGSTLEQDADTITLIDHYHFQQNRENREAFGYLRVAKNRHGPTGAFPVLWDYRHLKSIELEPDLIPSWVNRENLL